MKFKVRIFIFTLALLLSMQSVVVADSAFVSTIDNYVRLINNEQPLELDSESNVTTHTYYKMGKYVLYVGQLRKYLDSSLLEVPTWAYETLEFHENKIDEYSKLFSEITEPLNYYQYFDYIRKINKVNIDNVFNLMQSAESGEVKNIYLEHFEQIRLNLVYWSDSITFMRDIAGMDYVTYGSLVTEYEQYYEKIVQLNKLSEVTMNLDYIRPTEIFDHADELVTTILDENNNLRDWYLELVSLSAHTDGDKLGDYVNKLSKVSREQYDKNSRYRTPLYISNENKPIESLYSETHMSLKVSNLSEFLESADKEVVLFIKRASEDVLQVVDSVRDEDTEDDTTNSETGESKEKLEDNYIPIYMKSTYLNRPTGKVRWYETEVNGIKIPSYSTAVMNHFQLTNFISSGKANDFGEDLNYPLYVDMWGNIQTYSGRIIVPAVANMNYYTNNTYFPLNAYFINNYPIETSFMKGDSVSINDSLNKIAKAFTPDPQKYVVMVKRGDKESNEVDASNATFTLGKYTSKGLLKEESGVTANNRIMNTNVLPKLITSIKYKQNGEEKENAFINALAKNTEKFWGITSYEILALKESQVSVDGQIHNFMLINDNIPVEVWNFNYFKEEGVDKQNLNNLLLSEIMLGATKNLDNDPLQFKTENSQPVTFGFRLGGLLEPIHKSLSETVKNYNLYTPSVAELPGMTEYMSYLLAPALKLVIVLAVIVILIQYIRHYKTMTISEVAIGLVIVFGLNFAITTIYPGILNVGFNGFTSIMVGDEGYMLTLYNLEKDLNSKPEFVYGENYKNNKIVSSGSYIKLADLDEQQVRDFRSLQEDAPYKSNKYYIPDWDSSELYIGNTGLFVKGTSLYMNVKDMMHTTSMRYKDGAYLSYWETLPSFTYYTPYLSILEGLVNTVNSYTQGRLSPKRLVYSNGHEAYTGAALAYFASDYFVVDQESAMLDEEFYNEWASFNGGDYLNLKQVLYLEDNFENFTSDKSSLVKDSRWYKVAMQRYDNPELLTEEDIKDLNFRISKVNNNTKNFIIELIPYMNNISDEVVFKTISLYATAEFNKVFNMSKAEEVVHAGTYLKDIFNGSFWSTDRMTNSYPTKLELDALTLDEQLKLSMINMKDLLRFNITSLYKYVENEATWLGMILLSIVSGLMNIRSLFRIILISATLMIILLYMLVVYALRKDYSNKVIVGMFGILSTSWVIYFIDNLISLITNNVDKSSSGALWGVLIIWTLWNMIATSLYIVIFDTIRKDIQAFGGNIFYETANNILNKATLIGRQILSKVSDTRAEHFDLTNPEYEIKARNYEELLNQDYRDKMSDSMESIQMVKDHLGEKVGDKIKDSLPQFDSLKEGVASVASDTDGMVRLRPVNPIVNELQKDTLSAYGIVPEIHGVTGNTVYSGHIDSWNSMIQESKVKNESFELGVESDNSLYIPNNNFMRKALQRHDIDYEIGKDSTSLIIPEISSKPHVVSTLQNSLSKDIYKIETDKISALSRLEGNVNPTEYDIGNEAVYVKNKQVADEYFPNQYKTVKQVTPKIVDYADRTREGYVSDNADIVNGNLITNEYVYGGISKDAYNALLNSGVELNKLGDYLKFRPEDRDKVVDAVRNSTKFISNKVGVSFKSESPIDSMMAWRSTEYTPKETEEVVEEVAAGEEQEVNSQPVADELSREVISEIGELTDLNLD